MTLEIHRPRSVSFPRPGRNPSAPVRLVCLPFAGGSTASYAALEVAMGDLAETLVPELPGRGMRFGEPFATDLVALAQEIARDIAALPDKPLVLFGHSLGALLAFEIARALTARERPPAHLVLSGRRPPGHGASQAGDGHLGDAELVARMKRLGGSPEELFAREDLLAIVLPVVRADYALVAGYAPGPGSLPIAATILGGADDGDNPPDSLRAWDGVLNGALHVEIWAGGHFFIRPHERRLVELLRRALLSAAE